MILFILLLNALLHLKINN